jgi:hypothetical protein
MRRQLRVFIVVVSGVLALAACGSSDSAATPAPTVPAGTSEFAPRPENTMDLAAQAGVAVDAEEQLTFHEHATLQMTVDGEPVAVPANIGVGTASIAELHTHDTSGTLHLEAADEIGDDSFNLGQFFETWGVTLDENCVGDHCQPDAAATVTVDGEPFSGNPATIALRDGVAIDIAIS